MAEPNTITVKCRDCDTMITRGIGRGHHRKQLCEPCIKVAQRDSTNRYKRGMRATEKAARPPRICLDCPADITGTHSRTVRCTPCSDTHRRSRARDYLREWKRAQPKTTFRCKTCDAELDRKGRSGVGYYCDECRGAAKKATQERAEARARDQRGTVYVTHCSHCNAEFDEPKQRGRHPASCFACQRKRHYDYMRARTDARRPPVAQCRDCGKAVQLARKGPTVVRCASCAKKNQKAQWLKYAEVYRHMRRAWKYAVGYERFSPNEIYERDGWRCGVCRKAISKKLLHPDPMSVSLDHKISLSRGGPHSRRNAQPAHLRCNIRKNKYDALPGEQMPLPLVF